jgi:hypothetical protein
MSEASRAAALAHAAAVHHGSGDAIATLETAAAFHAYISPAAPEPEAAKPKPATPAKPKPVAAKPKPAPVEEDAAPEEGEVTKEQVGEAVEAMLNADLRVKAQALFKKYKATSLSSLSVEHYAAFKQEADDALLGA